MRLAAAWGLVLVCRCAASYATEVSLTERCTRLRDQLMAEGAAALLRATVSGQHPFPVFERLPRLIELEPDESLQILLAGDRAIRVFGSALPPPGLGSLRGEIRKDAERTRSGSAVYYDVDTANARVVRREAAWTPMGASRLAGVLMLERYAPVDRVEEAPLTGRWIGAYAHTARVAEGEGSPPLEIKSAGQLSVLLVQNGARLVIQCGHPTWRITATGLVVGDQFTAGGGRPAEQGDLYEVWFVEGAYEREKDRLRGTILTSQPGRIDRHTFYLHPAVPWPGD